MVRGENVRVLEEGLEQLSANGGRFEIHQLLFADHTALVLYGGDRHGGGSGKALACEACKSC